MEKRSDKDQILINIHEIKRKSFFGMITLTSRTFLMQLIALVATFILTVILDPAVFGIFFIVTAIVNFLNYFSDIGLAAALIQKTNEPTTEDLETTFTIQQLLVGSVVVVAFILSQPIAIYYHFDTSGIFLLRSLIVSFFFSSLKTIPSVILERRLEFKKLIFPQLIESVLFYITAIVLALKGFGISSFAWAALVRGLSGTLLIYMIVPWRPRLAISELSARKLIAFGLPYQANSFLALIKDDLFTVVLGKILPFAQVGYIGWAKKWSEIALRLIMDNIIRVTFPAYSRLQSQPNILVKAIEKSILLLSLLTFPIAIGMVFMVKPLIEIVPRYSKWEPALISFYFFTIASVLATLSSPLVNALNSMGKVKATFYLMLMWTLLTWVLMPIFIHLFGFQGVSIAAMMIGISSIVPYFIVRRLIRFNFSKLLIKPVLATLGMAGVMLIIFILMPTSRLKLIFGAIGGFISYLWLINLFLGEELRPFISLLFSKSKS